MPETFPERWARKQQAAGLLVTADDDMVACGQWTLPRRAAPFLGFDRADDPTPLLEAFPAPLDRPHADLCDLAPYLVIGTDGAGDPLCIEPATGVVWRFDHEDGFRTRQFVNSGVRHLAECLLAFLGEHDPGRFRAAVATVDPAALAPGTFWSHAADDLSEAG
jgi:hypothetical protein